MARDIGSLTTSQQFNDWVGAADSDDFYKFTLSNNSPTWNYSLRLSGLTADADVQLLSSSGSVIWHGANTGTSNELDSRALAAGTYYVRVLPGTSASETGYMLTLSATANAPPDGAGNTMSTAHEIGTLTTAQQFTDWVGASDDNDYYQFSLDAGANWNYTLFLSGLTADADVQLLNDSGESIWTGNASGITSESDSRPLAAGTYYVRAYPGSSSANTGYTLALSASRVNTAPNQKTIFETGIFDTGVGGQIKNFISGLLGRTLDSVRNYLSDRFEFFANSKWGIKLGFDVAADIGEGVSVDVASAEWGFSVEYDFAERTWRISRGFEASFLSASLSGDDYIIIPAEDDSVRPITVGVETTGGVTLIGGEVGIGIEKVLKAAVTLDGKLDANMAVAAETDLSQQEFLSLTGQSTIGNGILDSFGFITTNWKETVKEALGNWTPFGRLTLSLLGKSDDPLGLMRKGYGDLHVVLERTLNAESALGVNIGVGLGLGVGLSAGVYGKVYANTDIVVSNDVDYTFTRSELSPSDDVGDTTATASALLPRQTSAYTLGADDWDVFAFLSPASGTHQFSISAGTAQNFLILIRDPKERKVLKRVVASSGTTSRSFCAQEQGQYNLEIVAVATTTPGTYGVNWTPGKPDGTFSSGTVLYDTTGGINIVDRGDKAYACRLEEHSPATLTQTITLLQAKPVLTFSYRMATYGDGDEIQVRANGTVVWSLPIDNDQSDFVFTPSIDLSAYAGQSVELQIALLSVGTANASFEVDDIMLCEALTVGPQIGVTDNCDDPSDMAVTVPETTMGVSSDMFVFSLVNSGDAVLRVSSFAKGGSNPEDFVITVKNGTGTSVDWATDGFDITPGNVYTVEVIFQPSSADGGSRRSGAIAFETNDPQNSSVTLSVTGTVNRPPDRPDLASPSNGATNVSLTPILEASLFSDPDGNAHEASQWQIAASSDFASPVWDSGETSTDKTSQAVPSGGLSYSATYHWRVRYQDSQGAWSEWSDSRSFTVDRYSPVYRFWKASDNTHFYTIKEGEKQKLIDNYAHVYTYEGAAYYAYVKDQPPTGTLPVYRFWKPSDNTHFYTIKESEKDKLIREYPHIYTYEGPAYYAYVAGQQPAGTLPVYRFWKWAGNTHFFTIKESEKDKLIRDFSDIFTFENIVWYTYAG